jgi:hypothetical protein
MWTQVTFSYNSEEKNVYLYINDELICHINGIKQNIPFPVKNDLKTHDAIKPFILGFCPQVNTRYKGKISDFKIYDRFFKDINDIPTNVDNVVLSLDLNNENIIKQNIQITNEDIEIVENVIPFRREGSFYCLPHVDEGFIHGRWAKGETTARNEKRFVTEMQQRKIDYKNDGLSQILNVLDVDNVDNSTYPNTKIINCKMK